MAAKLSDDVGPPQSVIEETSEEGGIKFSVPLIDVEAGVTAGRKFANSRTINLLFAVPKEFEISVGAGLGLTAAIKTIKEGIRYSLRTSPILTPTNASYEVDFRMQRSTEGEIGFWFLSAGASEAVEHVNTVRITFQIYK